MTKIVIVLKDDGTYDTAYADVEVDVSVLRRGENDREIDAAENALEEVV